MYDYIIVGAGSAGCVLANRLSSDPSVTVLLLEAGGSDRQREVRIPAAFGKLFKSAVDWNYTTEPQPCLNHRSLYWPRGKVLGGSSSINAMIYIRGNPADYDAWAIDNPGWSYRDLLAYFKISEHQTRGASEFHGVGGPLHVSDQRYINPLSRAFVEAGVELGWPCNSDFNGTFQDGFGLYQVTQKDGRRHSAADAYLKPIVDRPNLDVLTGVHVTGIAFDQRRATGVRYTHMEFMLEMPCRREVILCGGAINSPQLLLLSGIGPADQLRSLGIPVVMDLPGVGQNLQDHPAVPVAWTCKRPISLLNAEKPRSVLHYLIRRNGPLTSNIAEAGAFVRSNPDLIAPDLQFHFAPVLYTDHGLTRPTIHAFTIGPTLITPRSRGYLALRSSDPFVAPIIQPNYLADNADLDVLLRGVKLARHLAATRAFAPFRDAELLPGPDVRSDADLIEHVRSRTETLYHPVGTCKMGRDSLAVVDHELRVHGLSGLRVVDASIMPAIVRGNTNAPTIAIAEKAAMMIKGDVSASDRLLTRVA